jgi:hypothetical protein
MPATAKEWGSPVSRFLRLRRIEDKLVGEEALGFYARNAHETCKTGDQKAETIARRSYRNLVDERGNIR